MSACRHCGWELPSGALFCGECGRSVTTGDELAPAGVSIETLVDRADGDREPLPETAGSLARFGGEWDSWASSNWADDEKPAGGSESPRDALEVEPDDDPEEAEPEREDAESDSDPAEPDEPEPDLAPGSADDAAPTDAIDVSLFEPTAPGLEPAPSPEPRPRTPAPPLLPVPDLGTPASRRADPDESAIDLETTRLVARSPSTRYVLQFSTGESVVVTGSGLIGRNPSAEPGEYVDQLVTLLDGGRSVSKTHLEYGQEQGRFWVSDRYSTNGSVVRPPDEPERRCEAGRRYLVSRGTRVEIGEQFFVVS